MDVVPGRSVLGDPNEENEPGPSTPKPTVTEAEEADEHEVLSDSSDSDSEEVMMAAYRYGTVPTVGLHADNHSEVVIQSYI